MTITVKYRIIETFVFIRLTKNFISILGNVADVTVSYSTTGSTDDNVILQPTQYVISKESPSSLQVTFVPYINAKSVTITLEKTTDGADSFTIDSVSVFACFEGTLSQNFQYTKTLLISYLKKRERAV